MTEFIFTCPQCKQSVQCGTNYVGSQINCPLCQQAIIVPPMPPTAAGPRERMIQIKVSTLRRAAFIGGGILLAGAIAASIFYFAGNSTQAVWKEWSVLQGNEDQWSFAAGKIHAHSTDGGSLLVSDKEYGDLTYSATVSTTNREATLAIRLQDAGNAYLILFAPANTHVPWNRTGFIDIRKVVSGTETTLASYNRGLSIVGQTAKIKIIAHGSSIEVWLNGKKIMKTNDSTYATGYIGLRIYGDPSHPCDSTFSGVSFHN